MATHWLGRPAARITMAAVAATAAACTVLAAPAWATPGQDTDLKILDQDERGNEVRLKVFSPAMHKELPVTVLLPDNYGERSSYPVLYALGGNGESDDRTWVKSTDIKQFAGSHEALIVLPPTEVGGFFSDWRDGSRKWETFHTSELPSLISSEFKGSGKQAVMGVSMGGFASMKYAAHNPGQYAAAASLSGAPISSTPETMPMYEFSMQQVGARVGQIWGNPVTEHASWRYEDPSQNFDKLRATNLFVSAATGVPSFAATRPENGTITQRVGALMKNPMNAREQVLSSALEQPVYAISVLFAQKASAAGLNVTSSFPKRGGHDWSTWNNEYKVAWSKVIAPSLGLPN